MFQWNYATGILVTFNSIISTDWMQIHGNCRCDTVAASVRLPSHVINLLLFRMPSSGMLRHLALVRTDVSEEYIVSIIRMTRISELGTTLAVTSNRSVLLTLFLARQFLSRWRWRRHVPMKRRFLQEPDGVTSQKTSFFIVTAVKTSNLT
jgi:hypothetical protein